MLLFMSSANKLKSVKNYKVNLFKLFRKSSRVVEKFLLASDIVEFHLYAIVSSADA